MQLTLLRSNGPSLAKTWLANGEIQPYANAKSFHHRSRDVDSIGDLYEVLVDLAHDPRSCLIRGRARSAPDPRALIERNLETFEDAPSRLFMVDVDNFPMTDIDTPATALERFVSTLPPCFQDVSYVWQLSGSMGHPTKAGQLRAHVWYLLDTPMTCVAAESWSKEYLPSADHTVHRTVQINYTANPVLLPGSPADPYGGSRIGFFQGALGECVRIGADMPVPDVAARQLSRSDRSSGMKDPRGAPGIVGAFSRAFEPTELPDLWPEFFDAGSTPERMTWRFGGGTAEGIRVCDNGTHLLSSHATTPMGNDRAHRMWDFVRKHVYGHLDEPYDEDAFALTPSAAPSWKAMEAWARAQPAVIAELDDASPERAAVIQAAVSHNIERQIELAPELNARLERIKAQITSMTTLHDLEFRIARVLATANDLSESDRESVAIALQKRTKDLLGKSLPIAIVRRWLLPMNANGQLLYPDVDKDGNLRRTIANLQALCEHLNVTIRYDVIRKRQDILAPSMSYVTEQNENASIAWLDSQAQTVGLNLGLNQLKGYVCEISARNVHNPVLEWIESKPWDGKSRFAELSASITLAEGFDRELADMMLRKWLIQAVAAAASPVPLQTRGVLVLAGEQYLGKSRWIKSLVPDHEDLATLGRTIDPHNKDSVKTAISHWIAELGELDATFKKSDIAALKAFLSNDEDTLRLPYAPSDSRFQRRTVFGASVNSEDEFLVDQTGNTRFWAISVLRMDAEHNIDMQQLWAEMLALWKSGEAHWFERHEMALVNASNEAFTQESSLSQRCRTYFPWEEGLSGNPDVVWRWTPIIKVAEMLGAPNATVFERKELGTTIGKITKKKSQSRHSVRYQQIPMWKSQLADDYEESTPNLKEAA